MIKIVLDSTVYKQDPQRTKIWFENLQKLCRENSVQLYIPAVVKDEYLTDFIKEQTRALSDVINSIYSLARKNILNNNSTQFFKMLNKLEKTKDQLPQKIIKEFNEWIKINNGKLVKIKNHHGNLVMSDYFNGNPPFKVQKNREDIPDAFIYQSVKDILVSEDELIFISGYNNLRSMVGKLRGVEVFNTLETFISSKQVKELLFDQFGRNHFKNILKIISRTPNYIEKKIRSDLYSFLNFSFVLVTTDNIKSKATITKVLKVNEIKVNYDESKYFSKGIIILPLVFEAEVLAEFTRDRYSLPDWEERNLQITTPEILNTNEIEVEDLVSIKVECLIKIEFGNLDPTNQPEIDLPIALQNAKISIDNIKSISQNFK